MEAQTKTEPSLAEWIVSAAQDGELELPPLPEIVTELQSLLQDGEADAPKVAELIRSEPAIVAALLKAANSAFYGGLSPVKDPTQAIARLGLGYVSSLVTTLAHKQTFQAQHPEARRVLHALWDHAVMTALAARRLALRAGADGEEAFLAGLLHDIGRLLVLKGIDMLEEQGKTGGLTPALIEELMETLHADLGHRVLTRWKLPETICRCARDHHSDLREEKDPQVLRVQAADLIARKLGAHLHPDPELNLLEQPAVERLGIRDIELATLMVDLEDEMDGVKKMLA